MRSKTYLLIMISLFALFLMIGCEEEPVATPVPALATQPPATIAPSRTEPPPTAAPSPTGPPTTATLMPTETPPSEASSEVAVAEVVDGLVAPVAFIPAPDGTGRMFIADQTGIIRILLPNGELLEEPFLDLSDRIVELNDGYDERGLLGLAFHPDYGQNGRFFVYYSAPLREEAPEDWDHTSHISEFAVSSTDPNRADPESERIFLEVDQPQGNHNAGQIAFGPDDYLYIPLGDGGAANDQAIGHPPIGNGQDITSLLGSILRIDVDGPEPYGIPSDNPFVDGEGREEIYAYGFRNPYRMSFDAGGDQVLFVADAGQNRYEEVSIVLLGNNYGWNIKEGTHCFDPDNPNESFTDCPDVGPNGRELVDPVIEYANINQFPDEGIGRVVVGGYFYRGSLLPESLGQYFFGDWSGAFDEPDGTLLSATQSDEGLWPIQELQVSNLTDGRLGAFILSFGQDANNELYVLTSETTGPTGDTGAIYKLVAPDPTPVVSVIDQEMISNTVTVAETVSDGPGWMVIHAEAEGGGPGPVIGHAEVADGRSLFVTVEINPEDATDTLYAMLHADTGTEGTYEFPDGDPPVQVEGDVVVQPFQVSGLEATTAESTPEAEEEATVEPTPTEAATDEQEVRVIEVTARNYEFVPGTIRIEAGQPVRFEVISADIYHTFTVKENEEATENLLNLEVFPDEDPVSQEYTFEEPGEYYLYCIPHEGLGMTGTIIVE